MQADKHLSQSRQAGQKAPRRSHRTILWTCFSTLQRACSTIRYLSPQAQSHKGKRWGTLSEQQRRRRPEHRLEAAEYDLRKRPRYVNIEQQTGKKIRPRLILPVRRRSMLDSSTASHLRTLHTIPTTNNSPTTRPPNSLAHSLPSRIPRPPPNPPPALHLLPLFAHLHHQPPHLQTHPKPLPRPHPPPLLQTRN